MKDLLIIFVVLLILLLLISSFGGSIKFNDVHKPIPLPYATKEEKEKFIADIPGIKNMTPKYVLNNIPKNNQKNVSFSEKLETFSVADSANKYMTTQFSTSEDTNIIEKYDNTDYTPDYTPDIPSYSEETSLNVTSENNLDAMETFDNKGVDISPYDDLHQVFAAFG